MNKYDWKRVEEALKSFHNVAELRVDGYKLSLHLEQISTYKNAIMIYVEDVFKVEWFNECEERRRFFRVERENFLTAKTIKGLSKKRQKELKEKYAYDYYTPIWTSFAALRRHLIANNESIELMEIRAWY